jgi:hypothetical protein
MMKIRTGALVVVLLASSSALYASEEMKAIVSSYLEIHAALAADRLDGIKPAARVLAEQSTKMGSGGTDMAKAARALEQASDLKAVREAFGPLSDAVIAAGKTQGWPDLSGIKVGFCPMVNRSWIQKEGAVANPYYGQAMSTCGTLSDPHK